MITPVSTDIGQFSAYFRERGDNLKRLGQDLKSGDLEAAAEHFKSIQSLGETGPLANKQAFLLRGRQHDFDAIGQHLQNADLTGARRVFLQLARSFASRWTSPGSSQQVESSLAVDVNA